MILVIVVLFFFFRSSDTEIKLDIEENVANHIGLIDETISGFSNLNDLHGYDGPVDCYLFKNEGELVYWSNSTYKPSAKDLPDNLRYVSNSSGDFLVGQKEVVWDDVDNGSLLAFIPVVRRYNVRNEYLEDQRNNSIVPSHVTINFPQDSIPILYQGETLFHIGLENDRVISKSKRQYLSFLFAILILLLLLLAYRVAIWVQTSASFLYAFFTLLALLTFVRVGLLVLAFPLFDLFPLFRAELISEGWFFYTLGDALFNILFGCILVIFVIERAPVVKSVLWAKVWAVLFNTLSYLVIFWFAVGVRLIQRKSALSLDITTSLQFNNERLVAFGLIALIAGLYFLVHYLAYNLTIRSFDQRKILWLQLILVFTLALLAIVFDKPVELVLVNTAFTFLIYFFRIPNSFSTLKFGSINFLIFTSVLMAAIGSIVIYKSQERTDRNEMQRFISYLQVDRDIEGEYILSDVLQVMASDLNTSQNTENWSNYRQFSQRLKKNYFDNYFGDYEVDIFFFDSANRGLNGKFTNLKLNEIQAQYAHKSFGTAYPNIFYDGRIDQNKRKKYICFLTLDEGYNSFQSIVIELTLKKFSSKRVLPQLLSERRVFQKSKFDYAHFLGGEFQYISGDYPFNAAFDLSWLDIEDLYQKGIEKNGYMLLGARINGKVTLVAHPEYKSIEILTNFSFLFVLQLVLFGLVAFVIALAKGLKSSNLHFSSKIMLYSVVSFVLPLVLVSLAVMQTTDGTNRKEIDNFNVKRTTLLSENLEGMLERYYQDANVVFQISQLLGEMSAYSGMDFNLYDRKGVLLGTNTPEIFEKKILTHYLNPQAYRQLILGESEKVIAEESVGNFNYKTSYVAINSPDTGKLLGVLASPYFASKNHVKRQQLQVFSNIINIFTVIFILSIVVAYWVITRLTQPISQIAERLHKTGFVQENQKLEWKADDEIGLLVKEYNNMLSKLEDSKAELAQNEKEAAWREMAKQVAHEIKNPLTPMKLTIQHLMRIFGGKEKDRKSLDILLGQIDTLDEIVTSFSHFAKMPIPDNKPFDIRRTLVRSIELHVDKEIQTSLEEGEYLINGDRKLFGRIFNNLILNAFEAMKGLEDQIFKVKLNSIDEKVILEFTDNGPGIAEDIQHKVFIPNFSTKASGSGIGLAVAKRGIEHAGGRIWFETERGKGTTFYIELTRSHPDQ